MEKNSIHNPNIDSSNHGTEYILQRDVKEIVSSQENYDNKKNHLIGRKMEKLTYENIFLKEASKNNVQLDILRDDETDILYIEGDEPFNIDSKDIVFNENEDADPYSVGVCTNR
jgi:hypothetical protein